jgi:hypothetical protein
LVSLTGNRDVVFDLVLPTEFNGDPFQFILPSYDITTISECLLIDTDNVHVKGVKGKFYNSPNWNQWWGGTDYVLPIQVGDNLPNIVVENCEGGPFSFGGDETYSYVYKEVNGTFIKCIGGVLSFASIGTASGLFIDCVGAANTFGKNGECSGIFINCKSEAGFQDCRGTFTNCESGGNGFSSIQGGRLYYCRLTNFFASFPTVSFGGVTVLCINGNNTINTQN